MPDDLVGAGSDSTEMAECRRVQAGVLSVLSGTSGERGDYFHGSVIGLEYTSAST